VTDRLSGQVPGGGARERAVRLAGALAELGVTRLVFQRPGDQPRELAARTTNLPGLILEAADGVLSAPALGLEVRIRADRLVWLATDERRAAAMREALTA
jgi:hypothetical protein